MDTKTVEAYTKARLQEAGLPVAPFASLPNKNGKDIEDVDFLGYIMMLHNTGRLRDGSVIIKPGGGFIIFDAKSMQETIAERVAPGGR